MGIKHTYEIAGVEYTQYLTVLQAVRKNCLECCAGSSEEVKACHLAKCPVYPFRFGKDPGRTKRVLSDEQKKRLSEGLQKSKLKGSVPVQDGD